jgi:hypothetical protein
MGQSFATCGTLPLAGRDGEGVATSSALQAYFR